MSALTKIMKYNEGFVNEGNYQEFETTKYPDQKIVILTCMDTRLLELLQKAIGLKNGDAKIIRNAGAVIANPFDSVMRSILISIHEFETKEVFIIGHHECGMASLQAEAILEKIKGQGIDEKCIDTIIQSGISLSDWLTGFGCVEKSVSQSVNIVKNHPLVPNNVVVHGLVIHPQTGQLELVIDGNENKQESSIEEGIYV
ncbi:beta-class carbonic anhydrase [Metabacillus arenae]|uniref:carbonic anhydrase n=1 Tax=Metabacillus arenae TaxID=2771434 RepID=A0A926NIF0_9BACI|nr:carbonic anhydrase [Metabacillus arenae]MBD1380588.1 carbonic anhydrase [Metabacillus arenae]